MLNSIHKNTSKLACILAIAILTTGCPPRNDNNAKSTTASTKGLTGGTGSTGGLTPPPTSTQDIVLVNATVSTTSGATSINLLASTTSAAAITINTVCDASGASSSGGSGSSGSNNSAAKPCVCRFTWTEVNPSNGIGTTRTADSAVSQALPYSATCAVPTVWDTEIPDGTQVRLSLVPDAVKGNAISFSSNVLNYTKNPSTSAADFRDAEGRAIKNVMHYVCYDQDVKPLTIQHAEEPGKQRPDGSTVSPPMVPLSNKFRTTNSSPSAQSYWYDFYVRSNEVGSINTSGNGFTCPKVRVAKKVGVSGTPTIVPQFFPLDQTFALALNASQRYPIEVQANLRINGTGSGSAAEQGVLGYASQPNSDGTCPAIPDSTGLTRRTFRLRRYIVNYPIRYNADGTVRSQSQPINTIYIMDRPVDKTGQDGLKPLTRLGPKPCPQSFNNSPTIAINGTTTASVSHSCTVGLSKIPYNFNTPQMNAAELSSAANLRPFLFGMPDGKKFGLTGNSVGNVVLGNARTYCLANGTNSATDDSGLALINSAASTCVPATPAQTGAFSNDFVSARNIDNIAIAKNSCPIYPPPAANLTPQASLNIRPEKGFVPEFLEDTNFKACAFQPSTPVDPDVVVAFNSYTYPQPGDRTTDNPKNARAFYCARTYPDPDWFEPPALGGTSTRVPGHCDSGRPNNVSLSNPSRYYVPKTNAFSGPESANGFIEFAGTTNRRSVQDAMITSYAIMNERAYACAFTYNPSLKKKYDPNSPLTDLTTPRSGCCQRGSGPTKTSGMSRAGVGQNAQNRGIHSLVDAIGPWYNRYGQPAFSMQSTLLTAAPYQLTPNTGTHNQAATCYDPATHSLTALCQTGNQGVTNETIGGHAITAGTWTSENSGTALGCYDPSEDP